MPAPLTPHKPLSPLPSIWPDSLLPQIQAELQGNTRKLIILDDDPLGCQTSYDLPIITDWSMDTLRAEIADPAPACFILTNSRSMSEDMAERVYEEIGCSLNQLEAETGQTFNLLTRCDSTLRGHFPAETEALQRGLQRPFAACLFIPFLAEGGRFTINDTHYVQQDEYLIPVAQTPYAQDFLFGFQSSNLRDWIVEKTNGRLTPNQITSISLDHIRQGGPQMVFSQLQQLENGRVCIINAATYRDMEVFVQGLLMAESQGKHFLYRTAASFIPVRLGLPPRPLLTTADLHLPASGGGLIIVGSHVPQTNAQLDALLATNIDNVEVNVPALLNAEQQIHEINQVSNKIKMSLRYQRDVVIYTSRQPVEATSFRQTVQICQRISKSLSTIVHNITVRPRYILIKGGLTASDIALQALDMRRAIVLGQILPGVPVWRLGAEGYFPHLCTIVFPGNVGDTQALTTAVTQLTNKSIS